MNKVMLIGRLTKDPETRQAGELEIASYTLAVDGRRSKNSEEHTDFIRCTCFGKTADFAEKYLRKGTKILVVGRINTGSYTDKDGKKVYTTDVIVDEHEFVESKASAQQPQEQAEGFMEVNIADVEDLPFA